MIMIMIQIVTCIALVTTTVIGVKGVIEKVRENKTKI